MNYKDYYQILGVSRSADADAIKTAYRKLAKEYHPDRNQGNAKAEARFKDINEAYTVLSDPEKRQVYDLYGSDKAPATPPPGGWGGGAGGASHDEGFSEFFRSIFGGAGGGRNPGYDDLLRQMAGQQAAGRAAAGGYAGSRDVEGRHVEGRDIEGLVPLPLLEALSGSQRTVEVGGKRLSVQVPAGARDGQKLRLARQAPGGGDVLLRIKHLANPDWQLDGDDLHGRVDLPAPRAVLGGPWRVITPRGEALMVQLAPGSQAGQKLRLRGQGWPKRDGTAGDLLLELRLVVPQHPSPEERALYEQLAALVTP
jgi:curved DNA-binding protein